ncbi:organic cation transporter 1 [Caerostris extrusa]|uniref:Organic cation transporter 1 n=1 Tax=Caerostris extrusa TaxID=172846 RepID=A0AAV4X295_CAEEX|nr:organic cation transporter 1 [Caerostris extrusa]
MANIMSYYGLQFNISNLAGNEFLNFFLLAIAEVPGYLSSWIIMERFGRRWCSVAGFFCTGVVCMLPTIEFPHIMTLSISSMLESISRCPNIYGHVPAKFELYPTVDSLNGNELHSRKHTLISLSSPLYCISWRRHSDRQRTVLLAEISGLSLMDTTSLEKTMAGEAVQRSSQVLQNGEFTPEM